MVWLSGRHARAGEGSASDESDGADLVRAATGVR